MGGYIGPTARSGNGNCKSVLHSPGRVIRKRTWLWAVSVSTFMSSYFLLGNVPFGGFVSVCRVVPWSGYCTRSVYVWTSSVLRRKPMSWCFRNVVMCLYCAGRIGYVDSGVVLGVLISHGQCQSKKSRQ